MESLQSVQKIHRIIKVLCRIGMVFAFVGAGIILVFAGLWYSSDGGTQISSILGSIGTEIGDASQNEILAELVCDFISVLFEGVLLCFALSYLNGELRDGTPFTAHGAKQVQSLGIKTIVLPLVAVVICSVVSVLFDVDVEPSISNGFSITIGVAMLLYSQVLRYGAELSEKNSAA